MAFYDKLIGNLIYMSLLQEKTPTWNNSHVTLGLFPKFVITQYV